ncbi:site-specific integrase [Aureimonas fodinaquatilis]|uniref:Site-specific integrase n=1 Tax=Aureimonas fodinaquatilis TaxID=2565783 RepID=A0A5B0DTY7_9HYPH|nr:site-specific integrase [Aureimonas fodinaquatilis]KAA0970277.1 site-specific integrase [Aureimonas fodinaquatilis]
MLELKKRPKSPYWYARGTVGGRRVEISTKCEKLADAKASLPGIIAELCADTYDQQAELTFIQALDLYERQHPNARFLKPVRRHFADKLVSEVTNAEMRRAANALYPGRSPATIRRQLYTPVKAILNCAAEDDLCVAPRIKSPTGDRKRTVFTTPAQADAIIISISKNANAFLPALVTMLFGQGCRTGEALSLDSRDVSLDHKYAILRNTKNGEERRISLIPRVIAALSTLPTVGVDGPLFRRHDGMGFSMRNAGGGQIAKPFAQAVKDAGLDENTITPHVCRHTWATWFYAQTKDVRRLQDEGGWKSGEWQRYTKLGTPSLALDALNSGWDFRELGENWGNEALRA